MLTISNLSMQFGGSVLFKNADLQFLPGNCYGVIGANGAGKSTFLKILSGELEPTSGSVSIKPGARMSVLKQDQFQYDEYTILDTVIMGNPRLYQVMKEKDALYEKEDFTEEDGLRASELEAEFAEMDGWEAESDASRLLQGLGIPVEQHNDRMGATDGRDKVKVLLAQALFGKPDIVMLDEPTNNLDIEAIDWLENFIMDYEDTGLVIVVSHDRHFLNTVCTHIVDIDYGKIKQYVGNYDFWYESSQLVQQLLRNKTKRNEEKRAELQTFISRFAANKSKSRQATSRRRLLDKLTVEDIRRAVRKLEKAGAPKFNRNGKGYYKCIIGSDAKFSLLGDALWEDKGKYQQAEQIENGEIGKLFGVIFIESSEAPVYAKAGASAADVGAALVFGEDAYGVVDLGVVGASPVRTIVKPLGSAGTADPLDQMATIGWKVDGFAAVILNQNWLVRVEHAIEA